MCYTADKQNDDVCAFGRYVCFCTCLCLSGPSSPVLLEPPKMGDEKWPRTQPVIEKHLISGGISQVHHHQQHQHPAELTDSLEVSSWPWCLVGNLLFSVEFFYQFEI